MKTALVRGIRHPIILFAIAELFIAQLSACAGNKTNGTSAGATGTGGQTSSGGISAAGDETSSAGTLGGVVSTVVHTGGDNGTGGVTTGAAYGQGGYWSSPLTSAIATSALAGNGGAGASGGTGGVASTMDGMGGTLSSGGADTSTAKGLGGFEGTFTTSAIEGSGGTSTSSGTGGVASTVDGLGGTSSTGGATVNSTDSQEGLGGVPSTGGMTSLGGSTSGDAGNPEDYIVALVRSSKANAVDLTIEDIAEVVSNAITQAGGLDFIKSGQTVVLKPNLVTAYTDHYRMVPADKSVNGISTDWRVVKVVADLVREKIGSDGKILVMEGSTMSTAKAFVMLGYTKANMSAVDEFIAIEGGSCSERTTNGLVQKTGKSGTQYWINKRYVEADVVISLPTMKTHLSAGITGGVKNLGIGVTPISQFAGDAGLGGADDCTRAQGAGTMSIDHSTPETLGAFIRDYYSIRPADFVVMDGLQGIEHGPAPAFDQKPDGGAYWEYASSRMNMRLVVAGRNAVAVDTVEALIMKCDPKKVPHLTMLEADGLGTTDVSQITVVGERIADVEKPFACRLTDICPGQ